MQFSLGNFERGLESGDSRIANSAARSILTTDPEVGKGEFEVPTPVLESTLLEWTWERRIPCSTGRHVPVCIFSEDPEEALTLTWALPQSELAPGASPAPWEVYL